MSNIYGSYFLQKLFGIINVNQRINILKFIKNDILKLAMSPNGTHCLQCLIELAKTNEEQSLLLEYFNNHIDKLITHVNGAHVIHKVLKCFEEPKRDSINNYILTNIMDLIVDMNGICVVKKFMRMNTSEELRSKLIHFATKNLILISKDSIGNYFIQSIFEEWGFLSTKSLLQIVISNIIILAVNKFSSNIIHFLLDAAPKVKIKLIIL